MHKLAFTAALCTQNISSVLLWILLSSTSARNLFDFMVGPELADNFFYEGSPIEFLSAVKVVKFVIFEIVVIVYLISYSHVS